MTKTAKKHPIGLAPIGRGDGSLANHGRPTMAWFFRPPVVDEQGLNLTGLPEDCFYTASAWMDHQVTAQTRKSVVVDGETQFNVLVLDVDVHGAKHNGAPVVAMHEVGVRPNGAANEDTKRRWGRICKALADVRAEELELERRLLAGVVDDLQYALGDPNARESLRERQRRLEARIAHLEDGVDFDALLEFFNAEARSSQAVLRNRNVADERAINRLVDERLAAQSPVGVA